LIRYSLTICSHSFLFSLPAPSTIRSHMILTSWIVWVSAR
jgi:hypothetical protein